MNQDYHDTTNAMEDKGVDQDYIIGWQGGYLGHPEREEQRLTDAYSAGFEDGQAKKTDGFDSWAK